MANKTWADIRSEVLNLGFAKLKNYEKNPAAYAESYNYAQTLMAATCAPIIFPVELEKVKKTPEVFDLQAVYRSHGAEWAGIASPGVVDEKGERIDNANLVGGFLLTLPADFCGRATVYGKKLPAPITADSPGDTPVEIAPKWANILPYLMANRLYMDDDSAVAGYYFNFYEAAKERLLSAENSPTVTVITGGDEQWQE